MLIDKLTIIIPVHNNRHDYLKRILEYYSGHNIKIIVCDSSEKEFPERNRYKIKYLYYKGCSFLEKFKKSVKKVKTDYVLLCAVDDFIVPKAILSCLKFLESNKDYVSAQGNYISFINKGNKVIYDVGYLELIGRDINGNNAAERLKQLFVLYAPLFYSVFRTRVLKKVFEVTSNKITNNNLTELSVGIISCIMGKHKVLPIFYYARENPRIKGGLDILHLDEVVANKKYNKMYNIFLMTTAKFLSKEEKITLNSAKLIVSESLGIYLEKLRKFRRSKKLVFIKAVDSALPPLGRLIKRIYYYFWRKEKLFFVKNIKGFPFNEHKDRKELEKIDYLIRKYNI